MKKMKILLSVLLCISAFAFTKAQGIQVQAQDPDIIVPGSKSINQAYLKPRNVFEKFCAFDSAGKLTWQATVNLVTRIDSLHGKLIYLQLWNSGKKDSTAVEWPSLRPIYNETF